MIVPGERQEDFDALLNNSFIDCEDDRNENERTFDQTVSVAAWIAAAIKKRSSPPATPSCVPHHL